MPGLQSALTMAPDRQRAELARFLERVTAGDTSLPAATQSLANKFLHALERACAENNVSCLGLQLQIMTVIAEKRPSDAFAMFGASAFAQRMSEVRGQACCSV